MQGKGQGKSSSSTTTTKSSAPASASLSAEALSSHEALKKKKAWEFAISPVKSLPMQAFMLYMSGGGVQIFSMGIVAMLLLSPFKNLSTVNTGALRRSTISIYQCHSNYFFFFQTHFSRTLPVAPPPLHRPTRCSTPLSALCATATAIVCDPRNGIVPCSGFI